MLGATIMVDKMLYGKRIINIYFEQNKSFVYTD